MENDDLPVGRLLTRREALKFLGLVGAALVAAGCAPGQTGTAPATSAGAATATGVAGQATASSAAACVVRPEMTVGPYFVDEQLNRSDIRTEPSDGSVKAGVPLTVAFNVMQIAAGACSPLAGAMVDVWHCDALGVYSGVADEATNGQKFLRGYQVTDASGHVEFQTIYPGWYTGRTVHFHFKIRATVPAGQDYEFTSQLYFDEAVTDQVFTQAPYNTTGQRDTTNATDMHYANGGDQLLGELVSTEGGYLSTLNLALDFADTATGEADVFSQGDRP